MERLFAPFEVKFADGAEVGTFSGYGAVFGNVDSYGDVIEKGAFRETLREAKKSKQWPSMLLQHGGWGLDADSLMPVGVWTEMEEDDIGLRVEGRLADTTRGREAHTLLKMQPRPALNGLSIGYVAKAWELGTKPDEPRRRLKKIDLFEVSLVTFPANPKARVGDVKSMTIRDFEAALRDALGLSAADAKRIAAGGFKALSESRDETEARLAMAAHVERIRKLRP